MEWRRCLFRLPQSPLGWRWAPLIDCDGQFEVIICDCLSTCGHPASDGRRPSIWRCGIPEGSSGEETVLLKRGSWSDDGGCSANSPSQCPSIHLYCFYSITCQQRSAFFLSSRKSAFCHFHFSFFSRLHFFFTPHPLHIPRNPCFVSWIPSGSLFRGINPQMHGDQPWQEFLYVLSLLAKLWHA